MAIKKTAAKSKPTKRAEVGRIELGDYAKEALKAYGTEVNENRATPALQDGLKPVTRRIIWSASKIGRDYTKAARIVGDVIGKYHPHGDTSVYGAMVVAATSDVPPLEGQGNWGNLVDPPAAMRYPAARLSIYGRQFVQPNYLAVSPLMPNYDDKDEEPIYLPCLLPNILLNSQTGIGYGTKSGFPGFTPDSLLPLMCRLLDREELTPLDYARGLTFSSSWGATVVKSKANRASILKLMESPTATVEFESPLIVDPTKKTITWNKFAPSVNIAGVIAKVKGQLPESKRTPTKKALDEAKYWKSVVQSVEGSKGLSYVINVRKTVNMNEFNAVVEKVKLLTRGSVSYNVYVSDRKLRVRNGRNEADTTFRALSVPQLIKAWLSYRVKLEAASLDYQIGEVEKQIAYMELLIHACDHLDVIFAALRRPNTAELIAKGLKITLDQANQILELRVKQLAKLDQDALKAKLKETQGKLKTLNVKRKKPAQSVKEYLEFCLTKFSAQNNRPTRSQTQWWLD
mgnify:FL=1